MLCKQITALLLTVFILLGCTAEGTNPAQSPKVAGCPVASKKTSTMEDLIKGKVDTAGAISSVAVVELKCTVRNDALRIDVQLANKSDAVRRVAYKFRWLDRDGLDAWNDESLKPVLLYAQSQHNIVGLAPTSNAVDFRVFLIDQDKH
jgi:uncharacterized protein YcfL